MASPSTQGSLPSVNLHWMHYYSHWASAMIICDCKSLLQALSHPGNQDPVVHDMQMSVAELLAINALLMAKVKGHCNFNGNELVDE